MENKHSLGNKVSFLKYILTCAIGFGIGGAIWGGWDLYGSDNGYPLTIIGAISLGLFGGLGFSVFSKNLKLILKILGLGILGSVIGFFLAWIGIYNLPNIFSQFVLALILPSRLPDNLIYFFDLLSGVANMPILIYTLNFMLAGVFIGLFFALALKTKIWPMVWRGAVGFGLAAIISPIIGNIIGNALSSLFVSYLVIFTLIGAVLGVFLGQGAYKNLKP